MVSEKVKTFFGKVRKRLDEKGVDIAKSAAKEAAGAIPVVGPIIKAALAEFLPDEQEELIKELKDLSKTQFKEIKEISAKMDVSVEYLKDIRKIALYSFEELRADHGEIIKKEEVIEKRTEKIEEILLHLIEILITEDKKSIKEIFECYKNTSDLTPSDFRIVKYLKYYFSEGEENKKIREVLSQGKNVLIVGRPLAGKTRAAYEAVRLMKDFKVAKFWDKIIDADKIPKSVNKEKIVLVFDDLNNFADNVNLYEVIKKFKETSERVVVVATCRSGNELKKAEGSFEDVLRDFEQVEIRDIEHAKANAIANNAGIEPKPFDGTIGSLFLGLDAMRIRFEQEFEECKILFGILKLCHDADIFTPRKSLLVEIYGRKIERDRFTAHMGTATIFKTLKDDSFIFVIALNAMQNIKVQHESYFDFIEYSASPADLKWLRGILSNDAEGQIYIGNAFYSRGLLKEAIESYEGSLNLKETALAYYKRGIGFGGLEQHKSAIGDFEKAIELNPSYTEAYYNCGAAYLGLGQHERALENYNKAIELNPSYAGAYNNRGVAFGGLGQHERAIEDYNKAIALNPSYAGAYNNRGVAFGGLGQHERAIEDYNKAIALNPRYAEPYNNRGADYLDLGQHKKAIEDCNKAIELNPGYAKAYCIRGAAYFGLEQYEMVRENYNKAIELNPGYAEFFERTKPHLKAIEEGSMRERLKIQQYKKPKEAISAYDTISGYR